MQRWTFLLWWLIPEERDTGSEGECCLFIHTMVCEHISFMAACVSTFKHYYPSKWTGSHIENSRSILVPLVISIISVVFARVVGWGWSDGKLETNFLFFVYVDLQKSNFSLNKLEICLVMVHVNIIFIFDFFVSGESPRFTVVPPATGISWFLRW